MLLACVIPVVNSLCIPDNLKSSKNFNIIYCPCVKNNNCTRKQAIIIYQKLTSHFTFMLSNFKIP